LEKGKKNYRLLVLLNSLISRQPHSQPINGVIFSGP